LAGHECERGGVLCDDHAAAALFANRARLHGGAERRHARGARGRRADLNNHRRPLNWENRHPSDDEQWIRIARLVYLYARRYQPRCRPSDLLVAEHHQRLCVRLDFGAIDYNGGKYAQNGADRRRDGHLQSDAESRWRHWHLGDDHAACPSRPMASDESGLAPHAIQPALQAADPAVATLARIAGIWGILRQVVNPGLSAGFYTLLPHPRLTLPAVRPTGAVFQKGGSKRRCWRPALICRRSRASPVTLTSTRR